MKYLTTTSRRPAAMSVFNDMDRMFNLFETARVPSSRGFAADIAESEDGYRIVGNLPGFAGEDLDIRVEDNLLVIEAKVLEDAKKTDGEKVNWYNRERRQGDVKRSFVLPENVDKSSVDAEMKNGVLTVELKKKAEAKPFSVKVRSK